MADTGLQTHDPRDPGRTGGLRYAGLADFEPLLRRLGRHADLTAEETELVRSLGASRRRWRAGASLADGADAGPHFLLSGWACRQRVLRDGRRQIFDFILPGERFDLRPLSNGHAPETVVALTTADTVEAVAGLESANGLRDAVAAMRAEDEARMLNHIVRLGRLLAHEKLAHFLLDIQRRLGAANAASFPLPLTQELMADALGLSVVHMNRVLRQLRLQGVLEHRRGVAVVMNPKALAAAAVLGPGGN